MCGSSRVPGEEVENESNGRGSSIVSKICAFTFLNESNVKMILASKSDAVARMQVVKGCKACNARTAQN